MAGVVTDEIADMLTRIRNGIKARHMRVPMPASKLRLRIAEVLKEEGFFEGFEVDNSRVPAKLTVQLKYDHNRECVITGLKRVSRPGLRQYVRCKEIPTICQGLGIAIVSTSRGVMTDREARRQQVGGEYLCAIW